ncbi:MAG TPA: Asp-tRNA(Asn)/Glu-tRNA(Gln) amidotransferase subunit GatB [Solirubrobacterales bacterium]|nr:Asp-tRNA(Asn)/Glu-tRNA(Gln) amidotransferase subunit GatB [Solirubrobacterales bacterium]
MKLVPTIGLEIHVQLQTRTKMFCGCELEFGAEPNTHTCPICLGHPGTLPVTNEQAIEYATRIAVALGCEVAPRSIFHRKNYFYPDLPKGYQISQFDIPFGANGKLGDVRIHRVHLEEDAAKLTHVGDSGRIHGSGASLVDFNRGGTPLMEIVTEPDIEDPAAAREWLTLLRTTLRQLGVSDVNMEEGSLRCDANVSIRPEGSAELGTKTELKNMNSFRYLERGVEAEIARQRGIVEAGGTVEQETLHFDPTSGTLTPLRSKEYAHDYRYFPEPDLVPLAPAAADVEAASAALPELPEQRRDRYAAELGLNADAARLLAFDAELGSFFESATAAAGDGVEAKAIANWVTGDLVALAREAELEPTATAATPEALAALVGLVTAGSVNRGGAREVLAVLVRDGGEPAAIVERLDLGASDSGELEAIVEQAIADQPDAAAKVKAGEGKAIGAIVGAVMRETRGKADGGEVTRLIRAKLGL